MKSGSPISLDSSFHLRIAPIVLLVYNRPDQTCKTVEHLQGNDLAAGSDLYVFSDGPKNAAAEKGVNAVRSYLKTINGFRTVTIVERERNYGLANSVIDAVSRVCEQYDRVIVVEDDLLSAPDFLTFMNCALARYKTAKTVFSVTGFNYPITPPEEYTFDAFFSCRCSSWGWGTWLDRWKQADWVINDFVHFSHSPKQQREFNRGGDDLTPMLMMQMRQEIDSWAIRWAYTHFQHQALTLYPVQSKILNIGFDGSGVHCRAARVPQMPLSSSSIREYRLPDSVAENEHFSNGIRELHKVSFARTMAPKWVKSGAKWLLKRVAERSRWMREAKLVNSPPPLRDKGPQQD